MKNPSDEAGGGVVEMESGPRKAMEQSDHFGLAFLQVIKDDSQYGEYFSYEEYQALKQAATREEFEVFLNSTKHRGTRVFFDPRVTYRDLKLVIDRRQLKEECWEVATAGAHLPGLAVVALPFLALYGWLMSRVAIKEIEKKRAKLQEENALATGE